MNRSYIGEHRAPSIDRPNSTRNRVLAGATSVALSMTLTSSTHHTEAAPQPISTTSVFEMDCAQANNATIRNLRGEEAVVVRLDCVPQDKVSKKVRSL
jgi:hypothetical protein